MPEESYSFAQARARLDEIVGQVRKKDTSLEKSLDLLEEGVRLANQCTELIDHADWEAAGMPDSTGTEGMTSAQDAPETDSEAATEAEPASESGSTAEPDLEAAVEPAPEEAPSDTDES